MGLDVFHLHRKSPKRGKRKKQPRYLCVFLCAQYFCSVYPFLFSPPKIFLTAGPPSFLYSPTKSPLEWNLWANRRWRRRSPVKVSRPQSSSQTLFVSRFFQEVSSIVRFVQTGNTANTVPSSSSGGVGGLTSASEGGGGGSPRSKPVDLCPLLPYHHHHHNKQSSSPSSSSSSAVIARRAFRRLLLAAKGATGDRRISEKKRSQRRRQRELLQRRRKSAVSARDAGG